MARSGYRYQKQPDTNGSLREALGHLAQQHRRARGWTVNHKRVERLYREEGLTLPRRHPRRYPALRGSMARAVRPNECWAMDFIQDALATKRRLRCLTGIDEATRVSPLIAVEQSLPSDAVLEALDDVIRQSGALPSKHIRMENNQEEVFTEEEPLCLVHAHFP